MSPRLKPLILPKLVEERRKFDLPQPPSLSTLATLEREHVSCADDVDQAIACFSHVLSPDASDASPLPSPITPTFSRGGYSRYSGSASSLELAPSSCSDSPAAPASALAHASKGSKAFLPDVQEEPIERDAGHPTRRTDSDKSEDETGDDKSALFASQDELDATEDYDLYNCLCEFHPSQNLGPRILVADPPLRRRDLLASRPRPSALAFFSAL